MREFFKVSCVLVIGAAILTSACAWIADRPDQLTWILRISPIPIAILSLLLFLRLHYQRDLAPDLLYRHGRYFDRDGFCFHLLPSAVGGKCVFHLLFQNRYEKACTARIALRPVTFGGAHEPLVYMAVRCPGAAFGTAKVAVGVPAKLQGKKVSCDVGADVEYPDGKGKMLRFKDGIVLRRNTSFVDSFARTTSLLALMGGSILLHRPARLKCTLPNNVAKELPSAVPEPAEILWEPGDPLPQP